MHVNSSFSPALGQFASPWLSQSGQRTQEPTGKACCDEKPARASQSDVTETAAQSQLWASSLTQTRSITLQVRTQEGDLVDVEIGGRESSSQALYRASDGGSQLVAGARASSSESHFSFSVQGSLSEEEMQSLTDLVGKVESLAGKFFDGDAHAAVAHASRLGFDSATLSGFSLKMSETETRTQVQAYQRVSSYGDGEASAAAPSSLIQPISGFLDSLSSMLEQVSDSGLFDDPKAMLRDMFSGLASMDQKMREKAAIIEQSAAKPFKMLTQDLVDAAAAPASA